eukprot:TRINITY_DN6159_c0_g1_i4.p1 TRINITY_DN6159_c0_g1~~TRINITY_DN6159_c0_g1_i4.p1  ORF type:complete len:154 (-),score=8.70 TRINITY_DN6159_c0_g1_i4:367-768(-)
MWQYVIYIILGFYAWRILQLLRGKQSKSLMVIFGSGGHTAEMKRLLSPLDFSRFSSIVCIVANTDTLSQATTMGYFKEQGKDTAKLEWKNIPRSREVKQSYFTSIFTTLYAMLYSFFLVVRIEPSVVLHFIYV